MRNRRKRRCCPWSSENNIDIHPETDQRILGERNMKIQEDEAFARQLEMMERQEEESEGEINIINIDSKFKSHEVKHIDNYPEEEVDQITYKFNCPVCLRYFDKILAGKCCGNYLCHLCTDDFIKMGEKNKHFKMR